MNTRVALLVLVPILVTLLVLVSCAPAPAPPPQAMPTPLAPVTPSPATNPPAPKPSPNQTPDPGPKVAGPFQSPIAGGEAFPHVRVDRDARLVEVDGIVPIDAHNKETPDVFLEVIVCTRDSKEHESLVMTDARPSHVHAALLLLGLKPGAPGSVAFDGKSLVRTAPRGDGLRVTIAYTDAAGREVEAPAADWVVQSGARTPFRPSASGPAWVFAGSRFVKRNGKEWYDADGAGTLIGLTTFGGETVAWKDVLSPEASLDEPEWIADRTKVPPFGTPVVVRIRPAQ